MRKNLYRSLLVLATVVGFTLPFVASGQFPAESTIPKNKRKGNGRVKAGTPGPTPRTADGKVDLSGLWGYAGYTSDIAKDYDVGELPMKPEAERLFKERQANEGVEDPEARCLPTGVPRRDPYPYKLIQTKDIVVILYEGNIHSYRQIFLNRTSHPKDVNPTWYGDSVGHWEGDTLVVDTIGFNGGTWLDMAGHPASDKLHVIERYSRPSLGTLKWDITIDDPTYYTKPWNVTEIMPLMDAPGDEIIEYICQENERDATHLDKIKVDFDKKTKANKK